MDLVCQRMQKDMFTSLYCLEETADYCWVPLSSSDLCSCLNILNVLTVFQKKKHAFWKLNSLPLTFSPREELRLGPSQPGASYKCGTISNGTAGRRPTLIEPERLKDFGEEELLNGDVRVYDTKVVGGAEIMLMDPPKTRRVSEFRIVPRPPVQYLRFEDISAAAFRIQSGIQKTPCTVYSLSIAS